MQHGNTCLHEASWRGYSRLVKVLSNKATVDRQNNGGFTALHLACQAGHNQSARADPNLVNTYGDTALHTAVRYGHAGVARILLSARAAPDVQNKNGDTPLHIASAMGRKKLTKILLTSGCRTNQRNHQRETALDIGVRKEHDDICQMLQNPPDVITPIQRDELRASKYNNSKSASSSGSKDKSGKRRDLSSERRSGGGSSGKSHHKRDKSGGGSSKRSLELESSKDSPSHSRSSNDILPNWSPYGCHYHPNPQAFPPPNIDSLPEEPLRSGELYYLDLAGNIHKGPIGISEGCYCTPILQPTTSVVDSPAVQCAKNCQEQLRTLTTQLSKIHLDTQAQLSSLQSMLNEKLTQRESYQKNSCETQLKDWVKQYRRFRKELSKNPKALIQANELLERASTLMVTRPTSPCVEEEESDSDSGL
ncbi:Ankyrin repeat domain-containing protein 6 [Orchesella cincta]|uniref:Ankyrin repeat domain-containing protein 6 n=1 Tax=Orchesella cincta TaxID=48709 RepID=A0A1D2M5V0_ORCCI|nr:Ankyrin repeat domain-containing protein 6 [Orchesella cincta]